MNYKNISIFVSLLLIFASCVCAENFDKNKSGAIRPTPPAPKFSDAERQTELAARRAKVFAALDDKSALILMSAAPKIYTGDVDFLYRQENNLYYLTNLKQPGATLVLVKDGARQQEILFLPERDPSRETWDGRMYSSEDAARISGVKTITGAAGYNDFITSLKDKKPFVSADKNFTNSSVAEKIYLLLPEDEYDGDSKREFPKEIELSGQMNGYKIENAQPIFADLRQVKSPFELRILQHAIDITTEAQSRAMATAKTVEWEYETQAEIEYIFRKRNADYWGYPSIVGCGGNATTLHYVESQGAVKTGDLLLMDVGAEYEHYTADVTRTFPVSGKFTKEQAEIYQIVYEAQEAAARKIKPGAFFHESSNAARETIEKGLAKLGLISGVGAIIPGTEQQVPDGKGGTKTVGAPQYRLWYMHGWGHWLGMNVHDVGDYAKPYREGMVTTNEPGIYIGANALDYLPKTPEAQAFIAKIRPVFERYKNIGVRIEDDMLVTKTGAEWMTRNLPRSLADIEAFMARASNQVGLNRTGETTRSRHVSFLDVNKNLLFENLNESSIFKDDFPAAKNVRRGWILTGNETALFGAPHAD